MNQLQSIAEVLRNGKFLNIKEPLKKLGFKKVEFRYEGGAHWHIKTKDNKTIVIINKSNATAGANDIIEGEFIIGYL